MKKFKKKLSLLATIMMVITTINTGALNSNANGNDNIQATSQSAVATTSDPSIVITNTTPVGLTTINTAEGNIIIKNLQIEPTPNSSNVVFSLPNDTEDNKFFSIASNGKDIVCKEKLSNREYNIKVRATVDTKHNDKTFSILVKRPQSVDIRRDEQQNNILYIERVPSNIDPIVEADLEVGNDNIEKFEKINENNYKITFTKDSVLDGYIRIKFKDNKKLYILGFGNYLDGNKKYREANFYKLEDGSYKFDIRSLDILSLNKIDILNPEIISQNEYNDGDTLQKNQELELKLTDTSGATEMMNYLLQDGEFDSYKKYFKTNIQFNEPLRYSEHKQFTITYDNGITITTSVQLNIKPPAIKDISGTTSNMLYLEDESTKKGATIIDNLEIVGGAGNARFELIDNKDNFEIIDNNLLVKSEKLTKMQYSIKVKATDAANQNFEKTFDIRLKNLEQVKFVGAVATGKDDIETTTSIILTFDKNPANILPSNIEVKDSKSKKIEQFTFNIGSDSVKRVLVLPKNLEFEQGEEYTVTIISNPKGLNITPTEKTVTLHKLKPKAKHKIKDINAEVKQDLQEGEITANSVAISDIKAVDGKGTITFKLKNSNNDFEIRHTDVVDKWNIFVKNINLKAGNHKVTIIAEGEDIKSFEKEFTINVKIPKITDITANVKSDLQEGKENVKQNSEVISNLKVLGGSGEADFTIEDTDNKFYLENTSVKVYNTALTKGDYTVTIKSTDKKDNSVTYTKTFNLKVKEKDTPKQQIQEIKFEKIEPNGTSASADTTILKLTFDKDPGDLNGKVTVSNSTVSDVSGQGNTRDIFIKNVNVRNGEKVTVTISNPEGKNITPSSMDTVIYKRISSSSSSDDSSSNQNSSGSSGSSSKNSSSKESKSDKNSKNETKASENKSETKEDKNSNKTISTTLKIGKKSYVAIIDGIKVEKQADVAPIIKNGRTMLPARMISEMLGLNVKYDNKTRVASFLYKDNSKVEIKLGTKFMLVNGEKMPLTSDIVNINGRILLPLRDIQEAFKKLGLETEIKWDAKTKSVTVNK